MRPDATFAAASQRAAAPSISWAARSPRGPSFTIALGAWALATACARESVSENEPSPGESGSPAPSLVSATRTEQELLPRPSPPRTPSPLLGKWKTEENKVLEAVDAHGDIELRIVDAKAFAAQAYRVGEPRFTLKPRPDSPLYDVVDHVRPLPPAGLIFDDVARPSCLVAYTRVAKTPLTARLDAGADGTRLVVTTTQLSATKEMFETAGGRVTRCNDLEQSPTAPRETVLTRAD